VVSDKWGCFWLAMAPHCWLELWLAVAQHSCSVVSGIFRKWFGASFLSHSIHFSGDQLLSDDWLMILLRSFYPLFLWPAPFWRMTHCSFSNCWELPFWVVGQEQGVCCPGTTHATTLCWSIFVLARMSIAFDMQAFDMSFSLLLSAVASHTAARAFCFRLAVPFTFFVFPSFNLRHFTMTKVDIDCAILNEVKIKKLFCNITICNLTPKCTALKATGLLSCL